MSPEQELMAAPGTFLAKRVLEEAERRGVEFSGGERRYLLFAGGTDDVATDQALEELGRLEGFDADEFEERVNGLVESAYRFDLASDADAEKKYRLVFQSLNEMKTAPQIWIFWAPLMFQPSAEKAPSVWSRLGVALVLVAAIVRTAVDLWQVARWRFLLRDNIAAYIMSACAVVLLASFKERKLRTAAALVLLANAASIVLKQFGVSASTIREAAPALVLADLVGMCLGAEVAVRWLMESGRMHGSHAANA